MPGRITWDQVKRKSIGCSSKLGGKFAHRTRVVKKLKRRDKFVYFFFFVKFHNFKNDYLHLMLITIVIYYKRSFIFVWERYLFKKEYIYHFLIAFNISKEILYHVPFNLIILSNKLSKINYRINL